jgi:hypothetical protein
MRQIREQPIEIGPVLGSYLDQLPLDDVEPLARGRDDERTAVLDADPALVVPDVAD